MGIIDRLFGRGSSQPDYPTGIILDDTFGTDDCFSRIFLALAAEEGMADCEVKPPSPPSLEARQKCLEMLLIFDRFLIHNCRVRADLSRLESLGLTQLVPCSFSGEYDGRPPPLPDGVRPAKRYLFGHKAYSLSRFERDTAMALEGLLLQELPCSNRAEITRLNRDNFRDVMDALFLSNIVCNCTGREVFEQALQIGRASLTDDGGISIDPAFLRLASMVDLDESDGGNLVFLGNLTGVLRGVFSTLEASEATGLPVLVRAFGGDDPRSAGVEPSHGPIDESEASWRAYRIFLDEVAVVPKLSTLRDVLRLREDRRVVRFRHKLFEWSRAIRTGNVAVEQGMRKEIAHANTELRKVADCREAGRWITYLSLPVAIASVLGNVPLGLAIAPISVGLRLYSDALESRSGWVLLGR